MDIFWGSVFQGLQIGRKMRLATLTLTEWKHSQRVDFKVSKWRISVSVENIYETISRLQETENSTVIYRTIP